MKKRLITVLLAVAMAVACVVGLVACGDDASSVNGTYAVYMANTETKVADPNGQTIELKDGKVTTTVETETMKGEYEVKDGNIVMTRNDQKGTYKKKDNYYYYDFGSNKNQVIIICKKGETPKGYTVPTSEE